MLADHFTKPLQGELFRKFRAELMNIPEDMDMEDMGWDGVDQPKGVTWKLHNETDPTSPQDCVGNYSGPSLDDVVTAHEKCNKRRRESKYAGNSVLLNKKERSKRSLIGTSYADTVRNRGTVLEQ